MFDLMERAGSGLNDVPVPLPGRVMLFAGPGGVPMVRNAQGAIRAAGGAMVCRGAGAPVQSNVVDVQVFGSVNLAVFGAALGQGSFVTVDAPLFVKLGPGDTGAGCEVGLFVRVDNGAWVWWAAMDVGSGGAGAWQCAGLSAKLVMQAGHLMSLTGNNMLALSAGGGIVEWGFKLQRAVAQVQAVDALIKVW